MGEAEWRERAVIQAPAWPHAKADPRTWVPHAGFQTQFMAANVFEALGGGAAGPGKTDVLLWLWMRFANKPWMKVLILRRTKPELLEMRDRAVEYYRPFGGTWRTQDERFLFPGGGWVRMGYCDRYAHLERYMGLEYTGVGWDELGQVPQERWWTRILSRIRTSDVEARDYLMARATANPGGEGHAWVKRRFIAKCGRDGSRIYTDADTGESRQFCPGLITDNPSIDPGYIRRLRALPEREQKALIYGDWDAAEGLALEELEWRIHGRPVLRSIPTGWLQWGSFDWGFSHWAVFVWFASDELGMVHVLDCVWVRRLLPAQIAERVAEFVPVDQLSIIYASPDCWNVDGSKSDSNPVIADKLIEAGWSMTRANTDRIQRLAASREIVSYKKRDGMGGDTMPGILFHDTPGVRRLFTQLGEMVTDPDDPEKVLKVDINPTTFEGGDDGWDSFSFGVASRYDAGQAPEKAPIHAFDKAALAATADAQRRHTSKLLDGETVHRGDGSYDPDGPLEGGWEVL
jgi:hypothetical protein